MIIESLKKIQLRDGLKDQELADKLGIHRVSWQRIKKGRVPISDKFLVRVHRAFPQVDIFFADDVARVNNNVATDNPNAPDRPSWLKKVFRR